MCSLNKKHFKAHSIYICSRNMQVQKEMKKTRLQQQQLPICVILEMSLLLQNNTNIFLKNAELRRQ